MPEESELFQSLTPIEQKLMQNLHLVEVFGKRGRKVPILITPDVKESIDMLLQKREECHVLKDNPLVFALQRSSFGFGLSGGFTPCRHLRPSSGREHTIV